jgi:hypothetical protein
MCVYSLFSSVQSASFFDTKEKNASGLKRRKRKNVDLSLSQRLTQKKRNGRVQEDFDTCILIGIKYSCVSNGSIHARTISTRMPNGKTRNRTLEIPNHILVLLGRFTFFPRVVFLIRTTNNNNNNQALKKNALFFSLSLSFVFSE